MVFALGVNYTDFKGIFKGSLAPSLSRFDYKEKIKSRETKDFKIYNIGRL